MNFDNLKFEDLYFEGGAVKVSGVRFEQLSGIELIKVARKLATMLRDERRGAKKVAQRQEIARLTAEVAQLKSDKANLLFDLNKERAGSALKGWETVK